MQNQRICNFFLKGACRNGEQCKFKHDEAEKQKFQAGHQRRNSDGAVNQQRNNNPQFQFGGMRFQKRQPQQFNNNQRQPENQPQQFNNRQPENQEQRFNRNQQEGQNNNQSERFNPQRQNQEGGFNRFERNNQQGRFNNQQEGFNKDRFNNQGRFNQQGERQQYQPNRFQQFDKKPEQREDGQQQFPPRQFNYQQRRFEGQGNREGNDFNRNNNNRYNNNVSLTCEKKILENIQGLKIQDFVQCIYVKEFNVVGIVKTTQIAFYKIHDKIDVNSKTVVQLPENTQKVYKVWYQIENGILILIVSYGSTKISLRNIAVYPNIWSSFQHFTILEVSIKDIITCFIKDSFLFLYSNDGYLRAFLINNQKALPPRVYNFENPIESVLTVNKNGEDSYFIGLKNGNLVVFVNGQMHFIPHELNGQKYALVDMKLNKDNSHILLLFWHIEEESSRILSFDLGTMTIKQVFQNSLRIAQIEQHKEYLFCSNSLGIIDILKEDQNNQYTLHAFYPNSIQLNQTFNKILDMTKISTINQNQVQIDTLLIGRASDQNQENDNVELLSIE